VCGEALILDGNQLILEQIEVVLDIKLGDPRDDTDYQKGQLKRIFLDAFCGIFPPIRDLLSWRHINLDDFLQEIGEAEGIDQLKVLLFFLDYILLAKIRVVQTVVF